MDYRCCAIDGGGALRTGHGRFVEVVARTRRNLGVDKAGTLSEIVGDASVDHLYRQTACTCKHVDAGTALDTVFHHLPRDVLRIGRQSGFGGAMVAGKNQQCGA